MIDYRCWYCNKRYSVADERRGEQRLCSCGKRIRVPRRSGGRTRVWTVTDFVVETVVYGGGGALLGAGLGILIVTRIPIPGRPTKYIVATLTLIGFLVGAVGGERGINWVGQQIRDRERP